jgi:8-oxoguanine deaminase
MSAAPLWLADPLAILADGDAGGGVVVADGRIAELVPAGRRPQTAGASRFDASAHVVLPGLINTHHHFYQTLTRACPAAIDKPLFPWLEALYPIWARLRPEHLRLAVRAALAELLLSGTTTTSDHHYVFPPGLEDAIDIEVEEAQRLGLRVVLTRGSMSLSREDGGLPPREVVQSEDAILADCERLIGRHHAAGAGAMVQIALAPCSPFSVTESLMRETAALAARHDVRLHTHLAETEDEDAWCRARFGCRPLDYLERLGWLDGRVWLAHGIWFDGGEIERLGRARGGQPLPELQHDPRLGLLPGAGAGAGRRAGRARRRRLGQQRLLEPDRGGPPGLPAATPAPWGGDDLAQRCAALGDERLGRLPRTRRSRPDRAGTAGRSGAVPPR